MLQFIQDKILLCKRCEWKVDKRNTTWYCSKCFRTETRKTHWMFWTRFYKIRSQMNYRCSEKAKWSNYKDYFWKWVRVIRDNFEEFMSDMYDSYVTMSNKIWEENVSIERKDYNWNYCKENCIWIHINEQSKNKSNNKYYLYNWIFDTLAWWSRRLWINRLTLYSRIKDSWWSIEKTLSTLDTNKFWIKQKLVDIGWKKMTAKETAKYLWVSQSTVHRMIKKWLLLLAK